MSQFRYVVDKWEAKITAYECTKETTKFAWLKGVYMDPNASYQKRKGGDVFDTWAEAHAALTRRAELELNQARRQLERAQSLAGNVRGMKPPQEVS